MREKTHAHRNFVDTVSAEDKKIRIMQLTDELNSAKDKVVCQELNRFHLVLIDGKGKLDNQFRGRTDTFKNVVINQTHVLQNNA